jgi:TPR repeat protein
MTLASKYITCLACLWVLACSTSVPSHQFAAYFDAGTKAYDAGDYETALKYWQPLADNYDLAAMRNVGHLYRRGLGVAQNSQTAIAYYKAAAELGFAPAQYNLAMMYWRADGVAYDRDKAEKWMHQAVAQNYPPAIDWQARQDMSMQPMSDRDLESASAAEETAKK